MDFGNIINNLLNQMAFFHLGAGNYVMIVVAWCSYTLLSGRDLNPCC